mmetsp:Transcript_88659/g.253374  ORF Transcript_88659/g.253374 Transcript_88659/m.253374 type:complete len:104 (-) Transcript_88659:115-426(-)
MQVTLPDFLGGRQSPILVLIKVLGIAIQIKTGFSYWHLAMLAVLFCIAYVWHRVWYFNIADGGIHGRELEAQRAEERKALEAASAPPKRPGNKKKRRNDAQRR